MNGDDGEVIMEEENKRSADKNARDKRTTQHGSHALSLLADSLLVLT